LRIFICLEFCRQIFLEIAYFLINNGRKPGGIFILKNHETYMGLDENTFLIPITF